MHKYTKKKSKFFVVSSALFIAHKTGLFIPFENFISILILDETKMVETSRTRIIFSCFVFSWFLTVTASYEVLIINNVL
jgi:hypothetical protein